MVLALAARNPSRIVFTGRNQSRANDLLSTLREKHPQVLAEFLSMDLSSLTTVQQAVESLTPTLSSRLDLLVCNAGILAAPPGLSPDGYEIQWATNHLGHALLIKLLLPTLTATATTHGDARIVILTSEGMMLAPRSGILFDSLTTTQQDFGLGGPWKRYAQSKLANVLYAAQLAKHHPEVSSIAVHPGVVGTEMVQKLGFVQRMVVYVTSTVLGPEDGCWNSLWAATAPKGEFVNGGYYSPVGMAGKRTKFSHDEDLGRRVWEWTEEALKGYRPGEG